MYVLQQNEFRASRQRKNTYTRSKRDRTEFPKRLSERITARGKIERRNGLNFIKNESLDESK